jgi:creatinine amidohydrolase
MKNFIILILIFLLLPHVSGQTKFEQPLSTNFDELTAPDIINAVKQAGGVCLLPMGVLERHGPHLPLGSDIYQSRHVAGLAAKNEYCIVFPTYYFGLIDEARDLPGTLAYSHEIMWNLLQETCNELSRNGLKKIIIVNGHGGNNDFLKYFCMSQLHDPKDYVLLVFQPKEDATTQQTIKKLRKTAADGGHAGEEETSRIRAIRPDLIKTEMASSESGVDQQRLSDIPYQYTGIWWNARFPTNYAGDGSQSSAELGNFIMNNQVDQLVTLIKAIKKSNKIEEIQLKFFNDSEDPLKSKQ